MIPICQTACLAVILSGALSELQPPPIESMPLYATAYNWQLGGWNCDGNCNETAIGVQTRPELLGHTAACPSMWLGRITTTVITLADGSEWWCIDTFGDAENRRPLLLSHPYHGDSWVVRVDFATADPWSFEHNQQLLYGWSVEWRQVSEMEGE